MTKYGHRCLLDLQDYKVNINKKIRSIEDIYYTERPLTSDEEMRLASYKMKVAKVNDRMNKIREIDDSSLSETEKYCKIKKYALGASLAI